jgi:hypothetical protein
MTRWRVPRVVLPGGWPPFRAAVVAGALLGLTLASALAPGRVPALADWALTIAAAACSAYAYGVAVKLLTGGERTASFQILTSVVTGTCIVLHLAGVAPLPYLDLLAIALCVSHGVGRIGCTLAGCCHGRPARRGLYYDEAHAAAGFPRHLVGVTLLPTQVTEALLLLGLTLLLVWATLAPHAPGDVFAAFVCGYAGVRLVIDGERGDSAQPYALGLTRAPLALGAGVLLVARLSAVGVLPQRALWQLAPWAWVGVAALLLLLRRWRPELALLAPTHLAELRAAFDLLAGDSTPGAVPRVVSTSRGLRLSGQLHAQRNARHAHVTFSKSPSGLRPTEARALAEVTSQLLRWPGQELVVGAAGIFHVVPRPQAATVVVQETSA